MAEVPQVTEFRQIVDNQVIDFIEASRFFGEPLISLAYKVRRAFDLELDFIVRGVSIPRPVDDAFNNMIEPLCVAIREIQEYRDQNRRVEDFFNHMSTVSESLVALSWIGVAQAPCPFIRDMKDAGDYFGNRVLSTYKGNQRHQTWINKWNEVMRALEDYVKSYHLTGFSWGCAAPAVLSGIPAHHGAPRPPPPPPSCYSLMGGGDSRAALLEQINQGITITEMLRPVHRDLISRSALTASGSGAPVGVLHTAADAPRVFPPKLYLDGRKWRVEHQKDNYSLVVENTDMSQSLAMFKCQNVGLEVRNKMNGGSIDNCRRSTIVLHDVISSVELIRCENVKLQCNGTVPLISLDNCDSVQIFLTENSIGAEVISSKSSSLNVCLLADDGDYREIAVPEQIRTTVVNRQLVSTVVEKI